MSDTSKITEECKDCNTWPITHRITCECNCHDDFTPNERRVLRKLITQYELKEE